MTVTTLGAFQGADDHKGRRRIKDHFKLFQKLASFSSWSFQSCSSSWCSNWSRFFECQMSNGGGGEFLFQMIRLSSTPWNSTRQHLARGFSQIIQIIVDCDLIWTGPLIISLTINFDRSRQTFTTLRCTSSRRRRSVNRFFYWISGFN